MKKGFRRGLAAALCVCLSFSVLTGCTKKEKKADNTAALLTMKDGGSISAGAANLYLRYQQAEFETGIGAFLKSYYGEIWNADLTGTGEAYGNTFKAQVLEDLEHMLLTQAHASDYDVELSDEEKSAISDAADAFLSANSEETLEKMSATRESVEELLTLYTIREKTETAMSADVDTEVSDEEAAQRTVSYVAFVAQTEAVTEEIESVSEAVSEAAGEVEEAVSEAVAEAETEVKTKSADVSETEIDEAVEAATEEVGENAAENETEAETETESPEMIEARELALERAEAFLTVAMSTEDFSAAADEVTADESAHASASSFTFGDNDQYPAAAVIEATRGLEDGEVVDHVVVSGTTYYVLHVDDAFDEEATQKEKESIVNQRRQDAIDALYEEWVGEDTFTIDGAAWTSMVFDLAFAKETEAVTEGETEALSEGENVAESTTES